MRFVDVPGVSGVLLAYSGGPSGSQVASEVFHGASGSPWGVSGHSGDFGNILGAFQGFLGDFMGIPWGFRGLNGIL